MRTATVPLSLNILLKGQLKFLNERFEVCAVSGPGPDLDIVRQREGVAVKNIEMQRKISVFKDFISLIKLYRYFRKERPTIVHSITPKAGLLSMVAAKLAQVPIRIHTFTGLIFPTEQGFKQKLLIIMDRLLCYCATKIVPEGQGVKNDLVRYNITKKPLTLIANGNVNGIDLNYFDPNIYSQSEINNLRHALDIHSNDFVYIYVGRLVKDKGIEELIPAFLKLTKQVDSIKLLLVGSFEVDLDPLDSNIMEEIKTHPNIKFVGFQEDVRPYFATAQALVFPSHREGFPNVVLQAGAMGLPSIVTNINGCNEIIEEGKNGIIVPVKDTQSLEQAMKRLMEDTLYYQKLQSQTRAMIGNRFQQELVWQALLQEYNSLMNQNIK